MPTNPTAPDPTWLAALADAALRSARLTPEAVAADHGIPGAAVRELLAGRAAPCPEVWSTLGAAAGVDPAAWSAARTSDDAADALVASFTRTMGRPDWRQWIGVHGARWLEAHRARERGANPTPSTTGAPVVAFAPPAAVDPRYAECAANWRALRAALIDDLAGLPHEDLARLSWEVAKLARRGGAA